MVKVPAFLASILLLLPLAQAQITSIPGTGGINKGTTLPAACAVGDVFFDTDATAGQNIYGCTTTNNWSLEGAAGSFGDGALATLVSNIILWDSANASRTLTIGLSGATDPVFTFSNGVINISTGALQVGGTTVLVGSLSSGRVPYASGASTLTDDSGLAFNATTGLGVIKPVTVGQTGTETGAFKINGTTSGTVTLTSENAAGTFTLTIPALAANASVGNYTSGTADPPVSCVIGSRYVETDTNEAYTCTTTNTWTLDSGAGGAPAFSAITGDTNTTAAMVVGAGASLRTAAGIFGLPASTTLPGTCTVGDAYMDTDATTGQRFYLCESTNTWALQGGGGGVADGDKGDITVSASGATWTVDNSVITPAKTSLGTINSGGMPYFSSGTGWASSAALGAGDAILGGGAGATPYTTAASGTRLNISDRLFDHITTVGSGVNRVRIRSTLTSGTNIASLSFYDAFSSGTDVLSLSYSIGGTHELDFLRGTTSMMKMLGGTSGFVGIGQTAPTPVSTLGIQDMTATTGATSVIIQAGAGQSTTKLTRWLPNNATHGTGTDYSWITSDGAFAFGANVAAAGAVRIANNTAIGWRNAANGADVSLKVNASDQLESSGQILAANTGIEFTESDTNPTCAAGNYNIFADLSENKLKKCVNGSATDLDTTGGTPDFGTITGGTNTTAAMVVGTGGSLTVSGSGTINATSLGGTAAASYALLVSPSFTTPTLGTAAATAVTFGADPADAGAIRCSNNAVCVAAEIATPGTDMTITPNSSNQWAFSHAITAPGFINTGAGGVAGYMELTQGTATAASANSVMLMAPTGITTAYRWIMPTAVGATGVVKGTVSGTDATLSIAALVAGDLPSTLTSGTAITNAALTTPVITTNAQPASAGGAALGTNALPFSSLFIGSDGNTIQVTGTATSDKVWTLPDATDTAVGKATTDTLTNKTLDVEGTGNSVTTVDYLVIPAAGCNEGTAFLNMDTPTGDAQTAPTEACNDTGSIQRPTASFSGSAVNGMEFTFPLPPDWTGNIDITLRYVTTAATPSGNVEWDISTVCRATGESWDGSFNAIQTITDAVGSQNQPNDATQTSITTTGCAADEDMTIRISRDGTNDTNNDAALLLWSRLKLRRAQ